MHGGECRGAKPSYTPRSRLAVGVRFVGGGAHLALASASAHWSRIDSGEAALDIWAVNRVYMVNSTKHWRPMLNGYSGFIPKSYEKSYEAARGLPAQEALGDDRVAQIARIHELQEIASEGDIAIYRFRTP